MGEEEDSSCSLDSRQLWLSPAQRKRKAKSRCLRNLRRTHVIFSFSRHNNHVQLYMHRNKEVLLSVPTCMLYVIEFG